ncbi:3488_t:CDS:2 [Acaulospora morrowiae]|uniref:3488_t:CDS:1 n=1 Tax=Acaulospora morrowiae TaxID=94023 RepID=A0A9N9C4Q7_9GLOM|nr:3488_t:CDS:2 [Acaulospora morrowiae]
MNKASIASILNTDTPCTYVPSSMKPAVSANSTETLTPFSSSTLAAITNADSGFLDNTRSPFITPLKTHEQYSQEQTHVFSHNNFSLSNNLVLPRPPLSSDRQNPMQSRADGDEIRVPANFHSTFHTNFPIHTGAATNIVQSIPRIQLVPNEDVGIYKNLNAIVLNRDLLDTMGRQTDATANAYMKVPDTLRQVFDFKNTIVSTDPNNPLVEQNKAVRKKRFRRTKQQMLEDAMKAKEKGENDVKVSSPLSAPPKRGRKRARNLNFQRPQDRLKRPRNGYMIFMNEVYEETKLKNPNLKFGEISAAIGERWKNMSKEEQMPYHHKHEQEKLMYENAKQAMSKGAICFVEENIPSSSPSSEQKATNKTFENDPSASSTSILIPSQLLTPKSPAAKLPTLKLTPTSVSTSSNDMIIGGRAKLSQHAPFMQSPSASENIIKATASARGLPPATLLVTPLTTPCETDEIQKSTSIEELFEGVQSKTVVNTAEKSKSSNLDKGVADGDNLPSNLSPNSNEQIMFIEGDQKNEKIQKDQDISKIVSGGLKTEGLVLVDDYEDGGDDLEGMGVEEITQSLSPTYGTPQLKVEKRKGRGGKEEKVWEEKVKLDQERQKKKSEINIDLLMKESVTYGSRTSGRNNSTKKVTRSLLKGKQILNKDINRDFTPRREGLRSARRSSINNTKLTRSRNRSSPSKSVDDIASSSKSSPNILKDDDSHDMIEVDSDNTSDYDSDTSNDTRNKWHFPIVGTKTSPGLTPYRKRKVNSIDEDINESNATNKHGRSVGNRGGRRGQRTTRNANNSEDVSVKKVYKRRKVY